MMDAASVLAIVDRLAAAGITVWLDGGWGVDALLHEQTRPHADLDLVVAAADVAPAIDRLSMDGFAVVEDELPTRAMLTDHGGRRVDLHPVVFDAGGGGVQTLQDGRTWRYPPEGFAGAGVVGGRAVRCLTPEVQVLCHLGYEPDDDDRQDMARLHARFGVALPPPYRDR
jgi:lincosamide nucleotidyltransferase A/C/D/E